MLHLHRKRNDFFLINKKYTNDGRGRVFGDFSNCFTVCPASCCTLNQSSSLGIGIDGKLSAIPIVKARRMSSFSYNFQ